MQHYARPDARLAKARRLGFQAWRKRDEAERLAIPPREPDPVPGQEVYRITVECAGSMHIITAHWPRASGVRRPRSVRLNDARWEKLKLLGIDWLADRIDRAKVPVLCTYPNCDCHEPLDECGKTK